MAGLALALRVLAMASVASPWLLGAGLNRILLIDGTHWKCLGPNGMVWRVHTAFDPAFWSADPTQSDRSAGGRTTGASLTCNKGIWWSRIVPMACGHASPLCSLRWPTSLFASAPPSFPWKMSKAPPLRSWSGAYGLQAPAGGISSLPVWISYAHKRIQLRLIAFRLRKATTAEGRAASHSQGEQEPAQGAAKHAVFLGMGLGGHHPAPGALE